MKKEGEKRAENNWEAWGKDPWGTKETWGKRSKSTKDQPLYSQGRLHYPILHYYPIFHPTTPTLPSPSPPIQPTSTFCPTHPLPSTQLPKGKKTQEHNSKGIFILYLCNYFQEVKQQKGSPAELETAGAESVEDSNTKMKPSKSVCCLSPPYPVHCKQCQW